MEFFLYQRKKVFFSPADFTDCVDLKSVKIRVICGELLFNILLQSNFQALQIFQSQFCNGFCA